jgi:predicted acetyltransferase
LSLITKKFELIPIKLKDLKLVFSFSNEKDVRKWSLKKKKILLKDHIIWFKKRSKEKYFYKFIYNKKCCGLIRIDKSKNKYYLSYLISSKYRGKKFGVIMITKFLKKIKKKKIKNIYAVSFVNNVASNVTLFKSGFEIFRVDKKLNIYKAKI